MTKEQLELEAFKFRQAIEKARAAGSFRPNEYRPERMNNFPHDCCDDTADLFTHYLFHIDAAFYDWTTHDAVEKLRTVGGVQLSTVAKTHKPGGRNKTNYVEKEYGLPTLSGRQLLQNQAVGIKYLPKNSAQKYSSFRLQKDWIAYPADGRVEGRLGTPVIITENRNGWFASGHVGRIEANKNIHPGYLYLAFSHPIVQAQLSAVACGSVVDAVYPEDVEKFILPPQVEFDYDRVTVAWKMIDNADSLKEEACQTLLKQME